LPLPPLSIRKFDTAFAGTRTAFELWEGMAATPNRQPALISIEGRIASAGLVVSHLRRIADVLVSRPFVGLIRIYLRVLRTVISPFRKVARRRRATDVFAQLGIPHSKLLACII